MSWCSDADKATLLAGGLTEAAASLLCANNGFGGGSERRLLSSTDVIQKSVDASFMLFSAYLVFFMQAGFAMLCAGSVRSKNVMNILIKNVLDACVGCLAFYLFGFGVAYGKDKKGKASGFIGAGSFALARGENASGFHSEHSWNTFLFQWAFSAAAATIVSGSVAERTAFQAYLGYSFFLTAFVYPVVVHWVWDTSGWLSAFKTTGDGAMYSTGMIDFAGSGVVHMTGGFAGLMGAIIVGPRIGRFAEDGRPVAMPGHNASLVVLGTFILWVGWYGFNPGSMLAIVGEASKEVVARAAVTTTLSAAAGGITALTLNYSLYKVWDLIAVCNGVLAGLVSITAGCSVVEPFAALLAGAIGAVVEFAAVKLLLKLRIDDPLEAFPVHGACGMWGCLVVGLFAQKSYVAQAFNDKADHGVFYGGSGSLLACEIIGIICIALWTCGMLGPFFMLMKKMNMLRTSPEEEQAGLDESKHGGSAYNMEVGAAK